MMLEIVIVLIILMTVTGLVLFKRRKASGTNTAQVIYQILGTFILLIGIFLLFPAFYTLFHGNNNRQGIVFLIISLSLVFIGNFMTNWASRKKKSD
jgi:glycerol uptake facilitator-like aquaporin